MMANETDLRWIVERIVGLLDPDQVYLFGSHALGRARVESDLDLIIVVPSRLPQAHRGKDVVAALRAFPNRFDLLFYTPGELEEELRDQYSFAARVLSKGRLLYSKPGASGGKEISGGPLHTTG